MADLMQQARELLERFQRLEDTPPELVLMSCDRVLEAIAAALRAAPEVPARLSIPLRATGKGPNHDYIRGWNDCIDAVLAARPQGVKDAS